jgi:hypothetical protein
MGNNSVNGTYTQYIKDTQARWARMPKTNPLNEAITLVKAKALIGLDAEGNMTEIKRQLTDLREGHIVYLQDGTQIKFSRENNTFRHWE